MAVLNTGLAKVSGGYTIDQSLRFNDDDSAYLSRTPSSAGNRKTWTMSMWVKRSSSTYLRLFAAGTSLSSSHNNSTFCYFADGDIAFAGEGDNTFSLRTDRMFRDYSAWYHIILSMDTTQATASNRAKIYINGVQETSFSTETYPSQNQNTYVGNNNVHYLGRGTANNYYDGYLAEVNFVDGQALTPASFGETDEDYGHWKPTKYTGTYGTNGFYLDFSDSAALGDDAAGSNDWTVNNLTASSQVLDSCTNNFATQNPLHIHTDGTPTFSEGNLRIVTALTPAGRNVSTMGVTSGKYYAEMYHEAGVSGSWVAPRTVVGITTNAVDTIRGRDGGNIGSLSSSEDVGYGGQTGEKNVGDSWTSYGATWTIGDIIGVALNMDDNEVTFYKNNASQGTISFTAGGEGHFACGDTSAGGGLTAVWNYGQDSSFAGEKTSGSATATDSNGIGDFYYTPPSGYLALCTQNLPEPTVIPSEHFNTVLWTGDGSTKSITGVGFQPDLVWGKNRAEAWNHTLFDAVRGTGKLLQSNLTNAETTNDIWGYLSAFNSDGFTLTAGSSGINQVNDNSDAYVAWNWKANGSGVSNTDGSITSTVSANADAGFSIVSYTSPASGIYTVGHGLSSAPDLIINKGREQAGAWWTFTTLLDGSVDYVRLDGTTAKADDTASLSAPTSSVFSMVENYVQASQDSIAYCFHSVDGYSKVGSYTGNSNADGTFVYTGFKPVFVMIKNTSGWNWLMHDSAREPNNENDVYLMANSSAAESSTDYAHMDFVSNGFKLRSASIVGNGSSYNIIYIAFAETPFKYSNAR